MKTLEYPTIIGSVCEVKSGYKPPVPSKTEDEGERLLELTKDLHRRVYTAEQKMHMLSNMLQVQNLKLHLLSR